MRTNTMSQISSLDFNSAGSMYRNPYGRKDINFGPDGRFMSGEGTYPRRGRRDPRGPLPHPADDYRSYDAHRERRRLGQRLHTDRRLDPQRPRPLERRYSDRRRHAPRRRPSPRYLHSDPGRYLPQPMPYKAGWPDRAPIVDDSSSSLSSEPPGLLSTEYPMGLVFLIDGILLMLLAIFNTIYTNEDDRHKYCGYWTGFLAIELGIFGMLHKGDYKSTWKSLNYIVMSTLVTLAAFVSTVLVCEQFMPRIQRMADDVEKEKFIAEYIAANKWPFQNGTRVEDTINTAIGLDAAMLALIMILYLAPIAMAYVLFYYWKRHYDMENEIAPLCMPRLFNPWGQIPVACAITFFGTLAVFNVHGLSNGLAAGVSTHAPRFNAYVVTLGTGFLVWMGAIFGALTLMNPSKTGLTVGSLILTILGVCGCITSIILNVFGLVDNIKELQKVSNLQYSFAIFLTFSNIACLVGFFYSIGIMMRIISNLIYRDYGSEYDSSSGSTSYDSRDYEDKRRRRPYRDRY